MASSSNNHNKDTPHSDDQSKPENIFIQFRQFADAQVSSLLQSVIGLPSAFSKRPSGEIRWTDIDDELRRRDELQARQKELRDTEARKLNRTTSEEGTKAANPKHGSWEASSSTDRAEIDEAVIKDLPLYSPVTKSLFAHLRQRDEDEADWKDTGGLSIQDMFSFGLKMNQQLLDPDQEPMKLTQSILYHALNSSPKFRSDYSLLPYLMFSPYSPLRLGQSPTNAHSIDDFPYAEAFEDLLQTSRGVQTSPLFRIIPMGDFPPFMGNLMWISRLHLHGLLQPRETRPNPFLSVTPRDDQELLESHSRDGAGTELEMYDNFLRWATSPRTITEAARAGESFLSSLENSAAIAREQDQEACSEPPRGIMREILEAAKEFREVSGAPENQVYHANHNEAQLKPGRPKVEDPERVVSTSTTSERTVHEDGSIETSITVWKRYGSGRETSTTTHHYEDPALTESSKPKIEEENKQESATVDKKNGKSGWFWT